MSVVKDIVLEQESATLILTEGKLIVRYVTNVLMMILLVNG